MRFRFSFKAMLVAFTVVAIGVAIFSFRLHSAQRQREFVASLRAAEVSVWYRYETWNGTPIMNASDPFEANAGRFGYSNISSWKIWLGRRFGRDFVFDVGYVAAHHPLEAKLLRQIAMLRGLETLELNAHHPFSDEKWNALLECRQISTLTLRRNQHGEIRALAGISALEQLKSLSIDGGDISVDDARDIAKLKNLRELTLSLVSVTNDSLRPFAALKQLERFSITHRGTGPNDAAAGVAALTTLPRLQTLELGRLKSLDDNVFSQLEAMTQLETLSLEQASVTGAEIERLQKLPKLSKLTLIGTQVDDRAMEKLSQMPQLTSLDISFTKVTDAGLKHISQLQNLQSLSLGGNEITDAALIELARLPKLEELMLYKDNISDAGLEHIAKLPKLTAIWVGGNPRVTNAGRLKLKSQLANRNVYD